MTRQEELIQELAVIGTVFKIIRETGWKEPGFEVVLEKMRDRKLAQRRKERDA